MNKPKPESLLGYVHRQLDDSPYCFAKIARDSKVPYYTLMKLAHGHTVNPRIKTIEALADFFRGGEREAPESLCLYVTRKLGEHKGEWSEISVITKVPYFTMAKIFQGVTGNPRIGTLQPLADLFREIDSGKRQLSCSKQAEQQAA